MSKSAEHMIDCRSSEESCAVRSNEASDEGTLFWLNAAFRLQSITFSLAFEHPPHLFFGSSSCDTRPYVCSADEATCPSGVTTMCFGL